MEFTDTIDMELPHTAATYLGPAATHLRHLVRIDAEPRIRGEGGIDIDAEGGHSIALNYELD